MLEDSTFRKLRLFPSSGDSMINVGSLQGAQQSRRPLLFTQERGQNRFPKRHVFLVFRIPDDGQSPETQ
jgi:hypothetical protein